MTALKPYRVRLEQLSLSVTKDIEIGTTNKVVVHTYPFSNKKTIEHMGTDTDTLTLEFNLTQRATRGNPNVLRGWTRFLFLLASKGKPVTLVHPLLGEQKIHIISLKQTASPYEGATLYPTFTMEFEIADADAFSNTSIRDLLLFLLGLLKVILLNLLADSAFAQGFKQYKKRGGLFRSLLAKFGLEVVYDVVSGAYKLAKDGVNLIRSELALLDGRLNSTLQMLNNGALTLLSLRSRALSLPLRIENRISQVLSIWSNTISATRNLVDFSKTNNIIGYLKFVSAYDNPNITVSPMKRSEVVTVSKAIIESVQSYQTNLDKALLSTRDFVSTQIESEDNFLLVTEQGQNVIISEDSVTQTDALSKLSITKPDAKELLSLNDVMAYATYVTMLMFMVDSVVNADLDTVENALAQDSIDSISEAFNAVDNYFQGKIDENSHLTFVELKNSFEKYKEEIAPFIYDIESVNTLGNILTDLVYDKNGDLTLFEDTLSLNDTLFFDELPTTVQLYRENV